MGHFDLQVYKKTRCKKEGKTLSCIHKKDSYVNDYKNHGSSNVHRVPFFLCTVCSTDLGFECKHNINNSFI